MTTTTIGGRASAARVPTRANTPAPAISATAKPITRIPTPTSATTAGLRLIDRPRVIGPDAVAVIPQEWTRRVAG